MENINENCIDSKISDSRNYSTKSRFGLFNLRPKTILLNL